MSRREDRIIMMRLRLYDRVRNELIAEGKEPEVAGSSAFQQVRVLREKELAKRLGDSK